MIIVFCGRQEKTQDFAQEGQLSLGDAPGLS